MRIVTPSYKILTPISYNGIDELKAIEKVGRTCYKSEDRITDDGESAKKFVAMLIKNGHEAMIEFSTLTVQFEVDRGVTHELVRHRLSSFAQESTRYVNYSLDKNSNEITVVVPSEFEEEIMAGREKVKSEDLDIEDLSQGAVVWIDACEDAQDSYMTMTNILDYKPEIARSVLPNSTKATLNMSANYREWRNIFKLRCDSHAHPDMRRIMRPLLDELKTKIPVVFDDITYE